MASSSFAAAADALAASLKVKEGVAADEPYDFNEAFAGDDDGDDDDDEGHSSGVDEEME